MSPRLSIKKVQHLLLDNNIFPDRYYIVDGNCRYIEAIIGASGVRFLVYINTSEYSLPVSPSEVTYDLKQIQVPPVPSLASESIDIAEKYTAVIPPRIETREDLKNNYRININTSSDGSKELAFTLNDIAAQAQRLNYMVDASKFQIGILYNHYLHVRKRLYRIIDGSNQFNTNRSRRMLPVISVDDIVVEMTTLPDTILSIKTGVYRVLALNYDKHIVVMQNLVAKTNTLLHVLTDVKAKRDRFMHYRTALLDASRANLENPVFTEAEWNRMLDDLLNLDETLDNATLGIDTIFFDNILTFTQVLRNVEQILENRASV